MPEETSNVTYIDNDTMNIVFSALIINVESVNRKYGTLNDFLNQYALPGETNGKLFITSEINKPPYYLIELVENKMKPLGFKEYDDYFLVTEKLLEGVNRRISELLNKRIPECSKVNWLDSLMAESGIFVWHKTKRLEYGKWREEACPKRNLDYYQTLLIRYFKKVNPYKLQFFPKVFEIRDGRVRFGMMKHQGVLSLSVEHILEYTND